MQFGLIGRRLGHSFSQAYFTEKFAGLGLPHRYSLFELAEVGELPGLLQAHPELMGLNVTIPYKEDVLPYLSHVDAGGGEAKAVNVIVRRASGALEGYNTDLIGFAQTLRAWLEANGRAIPQTALVLGTGGASRAVQVALRGLGVEVRVVGRQAGVDVQGTPYLLYDELPGTLGRHELLVQTTPLGQYPLTEGLLPLPYEELGPGQLAYDLVYNPAETRFLAQCAAQGCLTINGLPMLHAQADAAWEMWAGRAGK